jgi:hypothetical protein
LFCSETINDCRLAQRTKWTCDADWIRILKEMYKRDTTLLFCCFHLFLKEWGCPCELSLTVSPFCHDLWLWQHAALNCLIQFGNRSWNECLGKTIKCIDSKCLIFFTKSEEVKSVLRRINLLQKLSELPYRLYVFWCCSS